LVGGARCDTNGTSSPQSLRTDNRRPSTAVGDRGSPPARARQSPDGTMVAFFWSGHTYRRHLCQVRDGEDLRRPTSARPPRTAWSPRSDRRAAANPGVFVISRWAGFRGSRFGTAVTWTPDGAPVPGHRQPVTAWDERERFSPSAESPKRRLTLVAANRRPEPRSRRTAIRRVLVHPSA
jgi:hypothetical protein